MFQCYRRVWFCLLVVSMSVSSFGFRFNEPDSKESNRGETAIIDKADEDGTWILRWNDEGDFVVHDLENPLKNGYSMNLGHPLEREFTYLSPDGRHIAIVSNIREEAEGENFFEKYRERKIYIYALPSLTLKRIIPMVIDRNLDLDMEDAADRLSWRTNMGWSPDGESYFLQNKAEGDFGATFIRYFINDPEGEEIKITLPEFETGQFLIFQPGEMHQTH